MRILVVSPYPEGLRNAVYERTPDALYSSNEAPEMWPEADWVICYGYRRIIKPETIAKYGNRIFNVHLSVLPWNRGADPNFWSWVDDTPKGVTIHQIDEGIDTGLIYSQAIVSLHDQHTLRSSYDELRRLAEAHFAVVWPSIRNGVIVPRLAPMCSVGTHHKSADKDSIFAKLPLGWDTPVSELKWTNARAD